MCLCPTSRSSSAVAAVGRIVHVGILAEVLWELQHQLVFHGPLLVDVPAQLRQLPHVVGEGLRRLPVCFDGERKVVLGEGQGVALRIRQKEPSDSFGESRIL